MVIYMFVKGGEFLKRVLIFFLIAVLVAMVLPSFADQVSKTFTDKQGTYEKTGFNPRGFGGFNTTFNATEETNTVTTGVALTTAQTQTLMDTQNKLTDLIGKIRGLKTKYSNTKSKGLLNALDQFEKQANQLNKEIYAFIQNPVVNNGNLNGRINSFVQREAALEHKVSVKEELLGKMSTKQVTNNKQNKDSTSSSNNSVNEKKTTKKQNKNIKNKNK